MFLEFNNVKIVEKINDSNQLQLQLNDDLSNIIKNGSLSFGECFMNGSWKTNDLHQLLSIFIKNKKIIENIIKKNVFFYFKSFCNKFRNKYFYHQKHVPHYDLDNELYENMLDKNM